MAGSFSDKIVIVTGAGGAIGRAAAIGFAQEGARVAVSDINRDSGAETVAQIRAAGGDALLVVGDVSKAADVEALVEQTVRSEEHTSELQSLMRISYAVF